MKRKSIILLVFVAAAIFSCTKDDISNFFAGFQSPSYFPTPAYQFEANPVTKEGFELGRKLFYDPILSVDNTISCGSCHIQTSAFTHHGHSVSHGFQDKLGKRNSMPIMNLAWEKNFMWDGAVFDLDLQAIAPITSPIEMNESMESVLNKLKQSSTYPALFAKAFGSSDITQQHFLKALSQFMLMCISNNAKYDSVQRKQAQFTALEQQGYAVFKAKCNTCHTEPLFTNQGFANNGISLRRLDDYGRYNTTMQENDKYTFKIPSLRNLQYTLPYMHDGRFFTIDTVLTHYQKQVENTPNLHPIFTSGTTRGIAISAEERMALKAFLQTLNDHYFLTNKLLGEPE